MSNKETYEQANEDLAEILNALDDATASLETVLVHLGDQMSPSDRTARWGVVNSNQALLKRIGWGEP